MTSLLVVAAAVMQIVAVAAEARISVPKAGVPRGGSVFEKGLCLIATAFDVADEVRVGGEVLVFRENLACARR